MVSFGASGPGGRSLEGAALATDGESSSPSGVTDQRSPADVPEAEGSTVYALELAGRNVYCSSARCVSALSAQGWRLSNPAQLATLVRQLATGQAGPTHDPSDHFR